MLDPFLRPGDTTVKQAVFAPRRVSRECILGIALVYNGFGRSGLGVLMLPSFFLGNWYPNGWVSDIGVRVML